MKIQPGWNLIGRHLFAENCEYAGMDYHFSYQPSVDSCKTFISKVKGFKWDGKRWLDWGHVDRGYKTLVQVIQETQA